MSKYTQIRMEFMNAGYSGHFMGYSQSTTLTFSLQEYLRFGQILLALGTSTADYNERAELMLVAVSEYRTAIAYQPDVRFPIRSFFTARILSRFPFTAVNGSSYQVRRRCH
jgi:hypothetical protein